MSCNGYNQQLYYGFEMRQIVHSTQCQATVYKSLISWPSWLHPAASQRTQTCTFCVWWQGLPESWCCHQGSTSWQTISWPAPLWCHQYEPWLHMTHTYPRVGVLDVALTPSCHDAGDNLIEHVDVGIGSGLSRCLATWSCWSRSGDTSRAGSWDFKMTLVLVRSVGCRRCRATSVWLIRAACCKSKCWLMAAWLHGCPRLWHSSWYVPLCLQLSWQHVVSPFKFTDFPQCLSIRVMKHR